MSRAAFAVNAVLAWLGVILTVVISTVDGHARTAVEPGLYGGTPLGWPGAPLRFLDSLSYFTIWSNIVVAVSTTITAMWVVYMLIRGLIGGTYPYGFVNVGTHGYAQVFTTIGAIFAFGLLIGALFGGVD